MSLHIYSSDCILQWSLYFTATYGEARVKLHQAEYTSDLTDTEDGLIKRKARSKLFQSQSKQLESSEHSDSEDELPPTPPEKHLWPAANKMTSQITIPTAQRVASATVHQIASPTAQRLASSTVQQIASPTAQRFASSTVHQIASPTAQRLASSTVQQIASPTAQRFASPSCEAMFSKLLTIVEEIKETQKVHGKMLNALLKKQDTSVMEVPDGVVFPLKTQADVEALEELLGDRSLMSAVVAMVADIGGTNVDDATRRMMKYILSNELALDYNMFGRHGKKKFKDLCLFNVLYGK
ncbi:uncharacterized protein LOC117940820 [Etheostoma cragini]|uniref:uncharacterized protein LOC117940820 n=1 Tax=Etheostoma cragini TaxID=417921 RepID=UPI00155DF8B0|nr:uncharacterized protein LOC117940820 [Etheostoma cragini]